MREEGVVANNALFFGTVAVWVWIMWHKFRYPWWAVVAGIALFFWAHGGLKW